MAARPHPTARRIGLGHELRQLRREAGLTLAQAVDGLGFDEMTLHRVETGWKSFRQAGHLRQLLERYGLVDDDQADRLVNLQREASSREWGADGSTHMVSGLPRLLAVEAMACQIRTFHPQLVPGLLQSVEYSRAVHEMHRPIDGVTTEFVRQSMERRAHRKTALTRETDPVKFWAVLSETALRYPVGGADIMRGQYEELLTLGEAENITLQVLPQGERAYVPLHEVIIMFLVDGLPTTVGCDTPMSTVVVSDEPREVSRFSRMFDSVVSNALPPRDTSKFLHRLMRESTE
ncbi:helix-turn-helix domain-containing protein [Streptomyces acidiscabies]|uniref:DNA-binding protein n=1 Tax=Streptomyces acidiscabies TaxID=42234 RepID=A0A0L0KAB1_9ACTN|nr:helix-turn-helix transcriptional regulator [Streptomyces acidiscabies]KND34594.1 DNA-binding protein [Streptomyces acidiscabies]